MSEETSASASSVVVAPAAANKPYDLSAFVLESVLSNMTNRKMVCCLGRFTDRGSESDRAIVIFEKTAFAETELSAAAASVEKVVVVADANDVIDLGAGGDGVKKDSTNRTKATYFSSESRLREEFVNDIYGNFECFPSPELNSLKTTIIYPATENHIVKYSTQEVFIFEESAADYIGKTLPYIEAEQFSLDWVHNILEHRKETERIVFEDPCPQNGFVLLPDLKWDGRTRETLYLLAIVHRRNIRSLRDLRAADLPLLRNILHRGSAAIAERYGVAAHQLRIYLHYQPSFYHLHVHFTYMQHEAPGIRCERGHLLRTVINNLELLDEYYQRATLPFTVVRRNKLYEIYAAAQVAQADGEQTETESVGEATAKTPKLDAPEAKADE